VIARIVVLPKPVVNDPQGVTVRQGLRQLGFAEVADVRVGKFLEVTLDDSVEPGTAGGRVKEMCEKLLANQVIEDYWVDVEPGPS
jgi:phosphoribosylformylglycinamidine synthase